MNRRNTTSFLLTCFAACAVASSAFALPRYTITDLGSLFGGGSFIWAVNSAGQAVGQSAPTSTPLVSQSFLWQGGPMIPLPGFGGAAESLARDINEQGDICGASATTTFMPAPFQTDPVVRAYLRVGGVTTQLPSLSAGISAAMALNESRQIVGWSHINPQTLAYHAFIWQNGVMTDLGSLSGNSLAADINEAGDIVGYTGNHAALWSGGILTDLAPFGEFHSVAVAVNDHLQIAGNHRTSFSVPFHAFIWENGHATDLGTLGGTWAEADGINNAGQIVGISGTATGISAFIWENGVMTDLRTLAPDLPTGAEASNISDNGLITAYAFVGGKYHVYLLTPVPTNPADLNSDGHVNGLDLALLLGQWGRCPICITTPCPCAADLDHNGSVNGLDLALLLGAWG